VTDRGGQVTVTSQRHCVRLIIARYTNTYLLIYLLTPDETHFYSRDAMLARVLLLWPSACLSMSVCVCLSQIEVLSKLLNKSSWVLAGGSFLPPILHCVNRKFGYLQKIMVLPSGETADTCQFQWEVLVARSR